LSNANLATLVASAVLPADIIAQLGCRIVSDVTVAGPPVTRTIVLSFLPASTALAHADLIVGNASGSSVRQVVGDAAGSGYVKPPLVQFNGGGDGIIQPAIAEATLSILSVAVVDGGSGYSANTRIVPMTPQLLGAAAPVLVPTIVAGVITAVAVTSGGDGFRDIAHLAAIDPSGLGVGFEGIGDMEVSGNIRIVNPGRGLQNTVAAPLTVTMVPYFKTLFPDTSDQRGPFWGLFAPVIARAVRGFVTSAPPVLA